jgi:hypothetical protein
MSSNAQVYILYSISSRSIILVSKFFGQCSRVQQPAANSNDSLAHTFFNLNLLGQVWQPSADNNCCLSHFKFKKSVPNGHNYLQQAVTPDQIIHQRAGGP